MRNIRAEDTDTGGTTRPQILPVANATLPYWRTELHEIDEHRSTATLPSECDIAIIGAGMSGVGTAYHLSKAFEGKTMPSIVLLEARQVCSGATGRNGGHCKIQTYTILNYRKRFPREVVEEVVHHIREQAYALKETVEMEDLDCEFELRRSLDVFLTDEEARKAAGGFRDSLKAGDAWTKLVDAVDRKHVEQITSVQGTKGAFGVPICSFWPYKFVSQLMARLVERKAVNLQTNTPVTKVSSVDGFNVLATPRGSLRAKKVVFATNGYTAGILSSYQGTIIPTKGTATHISAPTPVYPHLSNTYNINYGPTPSGVTRVDYLNPRPDGSIVVGGGQWTYSSDRSKWHNRWDDSVQLEEVRPHFDGLMQRHFKGWEQSGAKLNMMWTGIMGYTPDEMPHIGEVPGSDGSRFIIAGFNGGGMGLIFSSTRGLAEMISKGVRFEETDIPRLYKTSEERLR